MVHISTQRREAEQLQLLRLGLILGDVLCSSFSQVVKSRKKALVLFNCIDLAAIIFFVLYPSPNLTFFYVKTFLLGIGVEKDITTVISVTEYFDMFVNVILGVGLVFELPVLIFFLILFRIVTPGFLIRHSRYAILINFIIAAVVTPTPDIFNMTLFALPMCVLYYFGIFLGYLFVLRREGRPFPWVNVLKITALLLLIVAGVLYLAVSRHWLKLVPHWPYFSR